MSDLVRQSTSQVERCLRTPRKGPVLKNDSIILGFSLVPGREGSITEETPRIIVIETDGVDVERVSTSPPKSFLHVSLLLAFRRNIIEPVWIRYPADTVEVESETGGFVVLVQDIDLFANLGISVGNGRDRNEGNMGRKIGNAAYGM